MNTENEPKPAQETMNEKLTRWAEDPMTSVVAATGATIGSFGLVLSGIGAIHLALQ